VKIGYYNSSRPNRLALSLLATTVALCLSACGDDTRERALADQVAKLSSQLEAAETRITRMEDVHAIEKLTRSYGYYIDKGLWSQVVDLFAEDSTVEIGGEGIYKGKKGAERQFSLNFGKVIGRGPGQDGLHATTLFNHPQLQGVVDIDPDGHTAHGRWRTLAQVAWQGKLAMWNEGVYENEYVKEDGVWKFKKMKFWSTYFTNFDKGWAKEGVPPIGHSANTSSKDYPPDQESPPEDLRSMYPEHYFVPPFHYPNPVSGKPVTVPPEE
jgi:SnoaL-like protein